MSEYYEAQLKGKYQVTMNPPETLKELLWRITYFRRNEPSWRELTLSFKPSTTNFSADETIKNNTIDTLNALKAFYESASMLDPKLLNSNTSHYYLRKPAYWPAKNVVTKSPLKSPMVYDSAQQINTGLTTSVTDGTNISSAVTTKKADALRMQAADPFASIAAENISQDVESILETAKMILTSYGRPYTTTRGESCTRWIFNTRNTAMKAIALIVQECPWFIQAIKKFAFFNANMISMITGLNPNTQLYGHLESADNAAVESPRHLLTPLWSNVPNIEIASTSKLLSSMATGGTFNIAYINTNGVVGTPQNLLAIYCNDTYEPNMFATNYPLAAS